jgi:CMP-N,N'-diacetyllegionaminic acid synthase
MRPVVLIPARGGSKGVPGKNIRTLGDKPLLHYTIEAARGVVDDSLIYVSSDDPEIIKCAESAGLSVPFVRPSELATDEAGTFDVIVHLLEFVRKKNESVPDTLILLQPTSPFRTSSHIKEALELYKGGIDMVVSVKETHSNPYFVLFEENEQGFLCKSKSADFIRRQDCPKVWEYNGAIYIIRVASLLQRQSLQFDKTVKYVMDDFSSHDIDTPFDWLVAESIYNERQKLQTEKQL